MNIGSDHALCSLMSVGVACVLAKKDCLNKHAKKSDISVPHCPSNLLAMACRLSCCVSQSSYLAASELHDDCIRLFLDLVNISSMGVPMVDGDFHVAMGVP